MTLDPGAIGIRTILLDIEGTTTPIAFVRDVLFPYARRRLRAYLGQHRAEAEEAIARLQAEAGDRALDLDGLVSYVESLMERDVKSPGLKLLQGLIWRDGYEAGELRGEVFRDVPGAFQRWKGSGYTVAIYSSGSVLAQQWLFSTIATGTLVPYVDAFFDTAVGAKTSPSSYTRIGEALTTPIAQLLFVSDSPGELQAARTAGCQIAWSVRPGNAESKQIEGVPVITSFDDLC